VLVLGMIAQDLFEFPFHGLKASAKYPIRDTHLTFNQVLAITALP